VSSWNAPQTPGLDVICRGPSMIRDDGEFLEAAAAVFDALYELPRRAVLLGRDPA
jgi:hypothetical protein